MTISKKTMQLVVAGGVFVLLFACSIVTGATVGLFLPEQKDWWLTLGAFCLPALIGIGLAAAAYFVAGRMIEDDADSPSASAPVLTKDQYGGLTTVEPRARKADKRLFRWLLIGSAGLLLVGLDAIAFVIWRWEALELVAIEVVLGILAVAIFLFISWVQTRPNDWMEEVGWPVISGLAVLATVGFFVFAVGGPALGQTLSGWFGRILPGTAIVGTVLGYALWAVIAGLVIYGYNRLIDGNPSEGIIAVTIALPIMAIAAFFGFGLIEAFGESFAKVWLLYAILAAILTAIFVDQTEAWSGGFSSLFVTLAIFGAAWLISWAILSAVGATWGMFGQGATIVAVIISYGIYLSWVRSNMSRGGGQ